MIHATREPAWRITALPKATDYYYCALFAPHDVVCVLRVHGTEGEEAGGEATPAEGGEVLVSEGAPFETHLWRARLAIQRATNAMLAAFEVCATSVAVGVSCVVRRVCDRMLSYWCHLHRCCRRCFC